MLKSPHPALDLSFMRVKTRAEGGGIAYWTAVSAGAEKAPGTYTRDCEQGRQLGEEYLAYIGKHPTNFNATLLGCIVADMVAHGASRGLVIGFMGAVNEYAMSLAKLLATSSEGAE